MSEIKIKSSGSRPGAWTSRRANSKPLSPNAARTNLAAAQTVAAEKGRRRVDEVRAEFDRFVATEAGLAAARRSPTGRGTSLLVELPSKAQPAGRR
jgi:hypothetical protein